jgi:RND family efflux transporter MFP subunit
MLRTLLIPLAIVLVFVFGAGVLMATAPTLQPSSRVPVPISVRVQDVRPQTVRLKVHSQGSVQPATESQLIPEVSGRIEWISPNLVVGGYFRAGETLARIDTADYESARARMQAATVRAEAELQHAQYEYERQKSLSERNLTSRSQLENALRALRVAEAALREGRAGLAQAREDLARTELKAPFSGLVRQESVDVGQFVSRGAAIATLYASDSVEVRLPIADRQLAFLKLPPTMRGELPEHMQPRVQLSALYAGQQLTWDGRIVRTEAEIDISSRMVQLVARVDTSDSAAPLSVGLFVDAEIEGLDADDIVVLPRSALRNGNQVMIVDTENRLRYRDIEPLRLYQDDVLVQSGLAAGERVCVSPIQTPIDGMVVHPVSDTGNAT